MTSTKKYGVLVGVDGSPEAHAALRWGLREAQLRGVGLTAIGAWLPITPLPLSGGAAEEEITIHEDASRAHVNDAFAAIGDTGGVEVTREIVRGPAAATLLERSSEADVIVLGSRGLGGFGDLLLGSVSRQVTSHSDCPVVVIPPTDETDAEAEPSDEAGRVVVGVDTANTAAGALGFAFEQAARRGVGLTAIHTWEPAVADATLIGTPVVTLFEDVGDDEVRATATLLKTWRERYPEVDVRQRVVAGRPAPELINSSAGAELLVVGSRGRGGFVGLLLGSTSHTVLHHAKCPVAVVRNAKD